MADYLGLQQPPTKKFRTAGGTNDSEFDFKMISPFDTSDPTNTPDLFDLGADFNMDREENSLQVQQQQQPLPPPAQMPNNTLVSNPQATLYSTQQRMNYLPATRAQLSGYQTPSPQRIPTMPNSGMSRPVNGLQQQTTMYTPQQMNNPPRPTAYPRMSVPQQQTGIIRQSYNPSGMVTMNTNVTQMNIVKASDPNNNNLFVQNSQPQQQSTLIGLPPQHTVTQTNKPLQTGLPSLNSQQFNHFQVPQQQQQQQNNSLHTYNMRQGSMMDPSSNNSMNYIQPPIAQSHPQANNMMAAGPSGPTSTLVNPTSQSTEVQRKQFIQKQLVLLLHAHKCQQREKQTVNGDTTTRSSACTLPHCSTMKNVLQHMTRCTDHKACPVPHCVTSRQIILHWKQCTNVLCPICQPLKTPASLAQNNPTAANAVLGTVTSASLPPNTNQISKEWQRRVTEEMRNHLVQKIITALIPSTDAGITRDKRILNLTHYAQRVEMETFNIASNQEEYFHKLAEKIYKIQKELEDRREKKRLQDLQMATQSSTSMNDYSGKRPATMDSMAGGQGPPNRTAPQMDYSAFDMGHSQQTLTNVKAEPFVTLTNSGRALMPPNNGHGTFTVTNVPANENLDYLLNGGETIQSSQGHDVDMLDTSRTSQETHSFKNEPMSPRHAYQSSITAKKEEVTHPHPVLTGMIRSQTASSMNDENRSKLPPIDASSKQLPKHPVQFTADELCHHLQPVIDKMMAYDESHPFRQPVDPVALNILDYPKIIKRPMDISTMQMKLLHGDYQNPLQFCDDAWLMFNNAWLYNKKTTRVYKMCTKLSEVFTDAVDPVIQKLGYCCGRQYVYLPQVMFCYGNQLCCQIIRDGSYFYYNNTEPSRFNLSGDKYTFCAKCFDSVKGDSISVGDDPAQTLVDLPKHLFLPAKNDNQELESMIDCIVCARRWHQVCAHHLDQIWPEGFICNTCIHQYNIKRKDNRFAAPKLTVTDLAVRLEQRVNDFLRQENCVTGRVTIRILAASDKICEVKPRLKKYCQNQNQVPDGYPYRTKAIFAFQEIEGVDVVLFGMHVQEYDGRCGAPNTRRVYVSYLDSVHFFRPKHLRTDVYHEILIGYLDYAKQLGYVYAHIWACPPSEGDDYIFHCHPFEQRVPKPRRLQDWYKKMLDRSILEGVVIDYKDVMKDCLDNQVQNVLNIPYFEGDFWSNIIEESIKELDQEEEERRKHEVETARAIEDGSLDDTLELEDPTDMSDKRKSTTTYKKKNLKKTTSSQRKVAKKQMSNCTDLMSKIFSTMEKHKEAFFVIRLRNPLAGCPTVNDTDTLIQCDLMDTRDAFLNFARDKHYEFSSLRRAKFSTLALLYELHTSTTDKFNYNCNTCRQHCEVRYHCTECEDFDLCEKCYNIEPKHQHKMERSVPGVVDDGDQNSSNPNGKSMATSQLQRQQSMQRCIDALLHAANCRNANCFNHSCCRYKRVIQHTKECKGKNSQCNICKQVIFLCWYHAKSCMDQNCQVPFCTNLKTKIQKQRATSLQTDRRRMQAMMQQRTTSIHSQPQVSATPSTSSRTDSMPTSSFDSSTASSSMNSSSGKPSVPLIRTPQQTNWHPQAYLMSQKPNTGKPMGGGGPQASSSPLNVLINRVKQEQPMDESQRSESTDQKPPMFSPLINKTPLNRLSTSALPMNNPQTTFNQPSQQQQQQQQWYSTTPQQQFVPPPNYTAATRARYTAVLPAQPQQNQGSPQTLLAPLRANISPPAYLARSSSSNSTFPRPNMNVTLSRPSPYSSSPSSSSQGQDPSPR